jgi:hypothetical protein
MEGNEYFHSRGVQEAEHDFTIFPCAMGGSAVKCL